MSPLVTPSQTVGPFFAIGLPWPAGAERLVMSEDDAIEITGQVTDGAGAPVDDALIEIWQADRSGHFACADDPRSTSGDRSFTGFGRCATDESGRFRFVTCKPGRVPAADGRLQAPHLNVSLFARGLLVRLVTRLYFPDETDANAHDPVLSSIAPERRATLVANGAEATLRFDIRLQGDHETAFFAL
jgi:protocatechuate 3,4-dioxygenase alpha subunit